MPGVSDVVVCCVSSSFFQVTVVPLFTMIGCTVPNNEFLIIITQGLAQLGVALGPVDEPLESSAREAAAPDEGRAE